MELFSREDLKKIIAVSQDPCVSMFMPAFRAGKETRQNPIHFKNLIAEAEKRLSIRELDKRKIRSLLEPARHLLKDNRFWRFQSDGLAVFLSWDFFAYYRLPIDLEALAVVARQFHVKPLLPLLTGDGRFYILALSQNMVKLYQATRFKIDQMSIEGLPPNMDEALGYNNLERQAQFHTGTPPRSGKRDAMFHGHGGGADDKKEFLRLYFQKIDDALQSVLRDESAPLIVAAVEYLLPLYKEVNSYPHLLDEPVPGNPEQLKPDELHGQGWRIVEPLFTRERDEAYETCQILMDNQKASPRLGQVLPAAYNGRVDILFVAVGVQKWGTFDPQTRQLKTHRQKKPDDVDLLDYAAVHTLLNGGTVYAVKPEEVPGNSSLAAVFRY